MDGKELVQTVLPAPVIRLQHRRCLPQEMSGELSELVREPLDLGRSPLRPWLVQLGPADFVLAIQFHHAVVDDWALAVFECEFWELYSARVLGRPAELAPLPLQVGEYAAAQRRAGVDEADLAWWRERLHDAPRDCAFPPDRQRPLVLRHDGSQVRFRIGGDVSARLRTLARAQRTTPYTLFAAALAALLRARSGSRDLILGAPVSRRGQANLDQLIGCLTDILPLRVAVRPGQSFASLMRATRTVVLEAMSHRDVPLATLLREIVADRRTLGASGFCHTTLVVDDAPKVPLRLPAVTAERIYVHSGTSKFDVGFTLVIAEDGCYQGFLEYSTELYDQVTATGLAADYQKILSAVASDADRPVDGLL